jgi:solute carrier family 25 citrate transporter 1
MPDGSLSGGRSLLAGLGAGLAEAVFVVVPTETVKTRIVHSNLLYQPPVNLSNMSSLRAAKTLVNSPGYHGYRALYAGVTSTLLRQGVSSMLRFGTYSSLKNVVAGGSRPGQKLPSGVTFGIGAIAGAITVCE